MLEFRHVSLTVDARRLLDDVSFRLREKRISVLLGKNGCGKSTLIACANRMFHYAGTITLNGVDIARMPPASRAKCVAVLPQALPDTARTAREISLMGRSPFLSLFERFSEDDVRRAERALSVSGCAGFADRSAKSLSGGERQRAYLSLLLSQDSPLLLLDEPAAYLDADAKREFGELLQKLVRAEGKTVLLVTHDLNEAASVADDIIVMEAGRIVFCGTKRACIDGGIIESRFHVKKYACNGGGEQKLFFA